MDTELLVKGICFWIGFAITAVGYSYSIDIIEHIGMVIAIFFYYKICIYLHELDPEWNFFLFPSDK